MRRSVVLLAVWFLMAGNAVVGRFSSEQECYQEKARVESPMKTYTCVRGF